MDIEFINSTRIGPSANNLQYYFRSDTTHLYALLSNVLSPYKLLLRLVNDIPLCLGYNGPPISLKEYI